MVGGLGGVLGLSLVWLEVFVEVGDGRGTHRRAG